MPARARGKSVRRRAMRTKVKPRVKRPVARHTRKPPKGKASSKRRAGGKPKVTASSGLRELERSLAEALEQQAATSEILRVISRSPTDVQPVFDTIATASLKLCHANSAAVFTYDGELMHLGAIANLNPEAAAAIARGFPRPPGRYFTVSRAVLTADVVAIPDVLEDAEYDKPTALMGGYRSALAVPLIKEGKVVGGLAVHRPESGPFSAKHVDLLRT